MSLYTLFRESDRCSAVQVFRRIGDGEVEVFSFGELSKKVITKVASEPAGIDGQVTWVLAAELRSTVRTTLDILRLY